MYWNEMAGPSVKQPYFALNGSLPDQINSIYLKKVKIDLYSKSVFFNKNHHFIHKKNGTCLMITAWGQNQAF